MKFIKDNFPLIAAIWGSIAALTAYLLKADEKFVYNIILLATFCIVLLAILVRSLWGAKDQNIFYSFITDNLLANKSKRPLEVKTEIVIIEHKESPSIFENYREEFERVKGVKPTQFICDSTNIELQKKSLLDILLGTEAVIVVRTKELEKNTWVYEALEIWAFQNSHAPCLVIDKIAAEELEQLKLSPIPEKYFFIPDDKNSVSWRLLKRANERAFAWRNQASFNRMVAISFSFLLLMGFMISYFTSSLQRNKYNNRLQTERTVHENLLREVYYNGNKDYPTLQQIFNVIVKHTKDEYENSITGTNDDNLNVSYWYSYCGTIHQIGTTENESPRTGWPVNVPSIIGCAFAKPNRSVHWDETMAHPLVLPFNEEPVSEDYRCRYGPQGRRKLKSIVCTSYNSTQDNENTVGICVFTETKNNNVSAKSIDFLKKRTQEFSDFVFPLLKDKRLIPSETPN